MKTPNHLQEWAEALIAGFVSESPENSLELEPHEKAWDRPLAGFSRGDDPLYDFLKTDIGAFYWHPLEIFSAVFPDIDTTADQLAVISWVLPQTEKTRNDHKKQIRYPSERWARSRLFGEKFNEKLREFMVKKLGEAGFPALAPVLLPEWRREISEKYGYASRWSERHTAFVCGLGTFGLSDGLITPLGKAVRFGSVICRMDVLPAKRPYTSHHEYCLYYRNGKCRKCAERCPAGAISDAGHDKEICKKYVREVASVYTKTHSGIEVNNCGLCQTGVPCESRAPVSRRENHLL